MKKYFLFLLGFFFAGALTAHATTIYLTSTTTTTWTVPSDWNSSNNTIEVIGGGGGGGDEWTGSNGNGGGAGGAYSKISNASLSAGATVGISVGAAGTRGMPSGTAGGDTYLCNSTSNCSSISGTAVIVGAKGGGGAVADGAATSTGGQASSGVGTIKYSGGDGSLRGNNAWNGGGGGGSAGPNGNGGYGTNDLFLGSTGGGGGGGGNGGGTPATYPSGTAAGTGGNNSTGSGGGAGGNAGHIAGTSGTNGGGGGGGFNGSSTGLGTGANGGNGTEWDASHGSGGGGGGGANSDGSGGAGGTYGGGGGGAAGSSAGSSGLGGNGGQGLIVINYTPASSGPATPTTSTQNAALTGPSTLYSGLVGWWTFDGKNMVQNVADSSGNGNNGFMSGFTSTSSAVVQGKMGQALSFNGTTSYVDAGSNSSLKLTTTGTVAAWVRISGSQAFTIMFGNADSDNQLNGYDLQAFSTSIVTCQMAGPGGSTNMNVSVSLSDMKWHYIVCTWNGTGAGAGKVYVDGGPAQSFTLTTDPASASNFNFGRDVVNNNHYFKGVLDDVRVYNRALSATEATQLYNTANGGQKNVSLPGRGNLGSGMVGWYTFDGKDVKWAGATSTDASGNGNDATIMNMTNVGNVAQGKMGQAFTFKSSTLSHLQTPITAAIGTGSYTYTVWFKTTTSQLAGLISQRNTAGFPQFTLSMSNAGISSAGNLISFVDNDGTLQRSGVTSTAYNDGKWHFAALVRNSSTLTTLLYMDGVLSVTSNSTAIPNLTGTDNIMVGAAGDSGTAANFYFDGSLDDARIYNRALTASEVKSLYNMSK